MTNHNPETGIPYTVYAMNNINSDVAQDLWYGHGATDLSYESAYKELREEVTSEVREKIERGMIPEEDEEYAIEIEMDCRCDEIQIEEPAIEGTYEGVTYGIDWLGGAPLLWVFHSPYRGTFCQCSPCVPGACDGDNPDPDGHEGYAAPPSWLASEDQ